MDILVVTGNPDFRRLIIDALKNQSIDLSLAIYLSHWEQTNQLSAFQPVLLIIDIDDEADYLTAVREGNFNFSCYIIVVTKVEPSDEMVVELTQAGAANVLVSPTLGDLVVEGQRFNSKVWA